MNTGFQGDLCLSPRLFAVEAKDHPDGPETAEEREDSGLAGPEIRETEPPACAGENSPTGSEPVTTATEKPHVVYLLRNDRGELLYVGLSMVFGRRIKDHLKKKDWWREVARVDLEHHPSRFIAQERERELIRVLDPPHNVQHRRWAPWDCDDTVVVCTTCELEGGMEWTTTGDPREAFEHAGYLFAGHWVCDICLDSCQDVPPPKPEALMLAIEPEARSMLAAAEMIRAADRVAAPFGRRRVREAFARVSLSEEE